MVLKKAFLFVAAVFLVVITSFTNKAFAQKNSSIYFSIGYGTEWYTKQNIHIEQGDLGNSYEMLKAPGDNKTQTSLSILQFHYRLGYYTGHYQLWGIEANFDPANYRITDGKSITVKGTVNNTTVPKNTKVVFSAKDGYYYSFTGANLFLINLVRRFDLYHANSNKIRVDGIAKVGVGPAMPHFTNSLPINPIADPQLQFGGWNAGLEGGFRATLYRYFFVEVTGKYDYASFNTLKVYDGTARQNLNTFEVIGLLGFTFPTSKRNPLFRNERIITILPFYQQAKLAKEGQTDEADKNSKDTTDHNMFREVPPFNDILDKEAQEAADKYARLHPPDTFTNADSIAHADSIMRTDSIAHVDSIATQDSLDHIADSLHANRRKIRRHKNDQDTTLVAPAPPVLDSLGNPIPQPQAVKPAETTAPPVDGALPPVADSNAAPLSKKEIKKRQKEAEKAAKQKEKEAEEKAQQEKDAADKAAKEKEAAANAASAPPPPVADTSGTAHSSAKEEKNKAKEEKKEAKRKEKEAKEKAKEEERAAKAKAKEEEAAAKQKAKDDAEAQKKAAQDQADKEKADQDKQQDAPPPTDNK